MLLIHLLVLIFPRLPLVLSYFMSPGIETPSLVAILLDEKLVCYGINWSGQAVLTAGHCVDPNTTYVIRTGFYQESGSLKHALFHTETKEVVRFPKFNHTTYDHDMALLLLKDIIPVTHVTGPASPHKCFATIKYPCFLLIWNLQSESQEAFPVKINLRPGMCLNNEAFTGVTMQGRKFCGETDICLPDVSGASLNCQKEVTGMVIQTTCKRPFNKTKLIFINLNSALEEIVYLETSLIRNIADRRKLDHSYFRRQSSKFGLRSANPDLDSDAKFKNFGVSNKALRMVYILVLVFFVRADVK